MSSNARKGSPPRSSTTGITTLRSTKARVFVFLTLVILTAVFSASALTANQTAPDTATAQQAGFVASSFNNVMSFFGLAGAAPVADKTETANGCDTAPEGLIACYRGDNDSMDARGVHNGEWVGVYGYATGKVGTGAFSFNGENRVEVQNAADLSPATLTVDGWVNLSDVDGSFTVISKGDSYSLSIVRGELTFNSRNADGVVETVKANGTIKAGTWAHVAATFDGEMARLYIDGKESGSARRAAFGVSDAGLVIGSANGAAVRGNEEGVATAAAAPFTGLADEVKLFNRALTAKEIGDMAGNRPDAPQNITGFTITPSSIVEDSNFAQVAVTRDATNAGAPLSVNFVPSGTATTGPSCAAGVDAVLSQNSVTFVAGETGTKFFTIEICEDTIAEANELLTLTASLAGGGAGETITAANPQSLTIIDDDAVVSITTPVNRAEDAATDVSFTFTRAASTPNSGFVTVVNFTRTGGADDGDDGTTGGDDFDVNTDGTCLNETYNNATNSGSAEIPSGASSCTIEFEALNDLRVEPDEAITLTLAAGGYVATAPTAQTGLILNDDFATVNLGPNGLLNDTEGNPGAAGSFTFDPERQVPAGSQQQTLNIRFEITGTARCGVDYTVPVNGTNQVTAFACTGPNSGRGTFQFVGTELDPTDIPDVLVTSDTRVEPDETVIFTILPFNAAGVTIVPVGFTPVPAPATFDNSNTYTVIAPTSSTATIDDDDETITVTTPVANSPVSEAGPGGLQFNINRVSDSDGVGDDETPIDDNLTVTFTLSGTATCGPAAEYTVTSGSAGNAVTYDPATCTGTVNFLGEFLGINDLNAVVLVTPINDAVPENNETVILTITGGTTVGDEYSIGAVVGPDGATSGTATATGTITNDDIQVIVTANQTTVTEGSSTAPNAALATFTFTRIGETAAPTCVNFNASGSASAVDPDGAGPQVADYPAPTFGTAAVAPCTNTFTPGAGTSTGTISIPAGQGALTPANPNFPGIQTNSNTVSFSPTDDDNVEANEEIQVQVDNGVGYTPGTPAQASTLILNDDSQRVSVSVAPTEDAEGNSAPATTPGQYTFTFTRTQSDGAPLTVTYSVGGTATPGVDYTTPPFAGNNVVTFPAGAPGVAQTTTVVINAIADNDVETDETIILTVQDGTGYTAFAPNPATATIQNDDNDVTCTGPTGGAVGTPTVVTEGGTLTFTCTRNTDGAGNALPLQVPFTITGSGRITGGTASDPNDFTVGGDTQGSVTNNTGNSGLLLFTAGDDTATITVTSTNDTVVEGDETVIVTFPANGSDAVNTVSGNPQGFEVTPTVLTGTIGNNDNDVNISPATQSVFEDGAGNLVFTFTRATGGAAAGQDLPVQFVVTGTACDAVPCTGDASATPDYTLTFGTANAGNAFNASNGQGTVVIPANATSATVIVDPTPDTVVEPDETVILTIAAGANYTPIPGTSATGIIQNDDATFTVQFIGIEDVDLSQNPPTVLGTGQLEGNPGEPGDTVARFRVFRNGVNSSGGSVTISTVPGSGTATAGAPNTVCQPGEDYTTDGKVITFPLALNPPTQADSQDFLVRICRDTVFEFTETFDVQLTNPVGGAVAPNNGTLGNPSTATATILDDDNAPTLSLLCTPDPVNEGAGQTSCTVTLSQAIQGQNTTVTYSTTPGTATANVDYTTSTGSVTITSGSTTSAPFTIPIINDTLAEGTETFTVNIVGPSATVLNPTPPTVLVGSQVIDIVDNEASTSFAVSDVRQIEGNDSSNDPNVASTSSFNFRITRTGDAQGTEVVCFRTVNGDIENPAINPNPATAGPNVGLTGNYANDYNPLVAGPTNCVTFTQGGPSVITVPVIVYGDPVFENDESFTLELLSVNGNTNPQGVDINGNPTGNRITDRLGLGLIQNDDGVDAFSITQDAQPSPAGPNQVIEGNSGTRTVTYTITRPNSGVASSVTVTLAGSANAQFTGAVAGTTCGALNSGTDVARSPMSATLNFAAGVSSQTFTVSVCGDTAFELNETYTVSLSNANNAIVGANGSVTTTILNDDATPVLSVSDVVVCEPQSGTTGAVFTINRTGLSFLPTVVSVATVDGTAQDGGPGEDTDFVAITPQTTTTNTVTIPAGAAGSTGVEAGTVTVTVNGDQVFETDETFTLQVTNATNAVFQAGQGGDPIGGGIIQNAGSGCGTNVDPAPTFAVGPVNQVEGTTNPVTAGIFYFRVTRTGNTQVPASLTYSTTSGTATGGTSCSDAGTDFITVTNAPIAGGNFPANGFTPSAGPPAQGANFIDIPVQVCQDAIFENNEAFTVTIATTNQFAQLSPQGTTATGTIINDDGLAFSIRNPGPEGAEGNTGQTTSFVFTIDRTGDSSVSTVICYQTVAGTATEGVDYTALPANATNCVTFLAGEMSKNITVSVIGDNTPEADETFFLRIISATIGGNPAPAGTIPTGNTGDRLATINNDDGPFNPINCGVEGDVVGANGEAIGDGAVLANDVSAIRQFILGNGTAATGACPSNQFQRADVNNNGLIDAGDVTIIRQMILGNVPNNTPATGPTTPNAPRAAATSSTGDDAGRPDAVLRIIRAVNTQVAPGATQVVVPFQLDSQGDEASLSFTVNFDPTKLTYVSAVAGNGVPAGTVPTFNTSQIAQGRLGVLLDSTNTYAAGTRNILNVTFNLAAGFVAGQQTNVSFSGTPTIQTTSNAQGVLLETAYQTGVVTFPVTAAGVRVSGRVTSANGQGLRNATVTITDASGNRRTATTGSFGIYTFDDVEAGQSYILGVSSKRYRFASRSVNVTDSLADVNFVGQE